MKKTGLIVGIIIGVIVIAALVIWLVIALLLPASSTTSPGTVPAPTTSAGISTSTPTSTSPKPAGTTSPASADVNFALNVTGVNTSGLSATVTAQLTNSGKNDAHNVQAKVEVFVQGSKINVTGDTSLKIGTLKAGETITRQPVFTFSLFDAPKLMQNGANFNLTISSDEKTQTLSYDYHP